jgi:hypothetical protein
MADPFGAKPVPRSAGRLTPADRYLDGGSRWEAATPAERAECMRNEAKHREAFETEQTTARITFTKVAP